MNDDHVVELVDRLFEGLPRTAVPPGLRVEGERRLRHRRAARACVVVAAVAVIGGIVMGLALITAGSDPAGPAASDPEATELTVTFERDLDPDDPGTASWDGTTLTYVGRSYYSGSCGAVGSASMAGSTVRLVMRDGGSADQICTADAVVFTARVSGLRIAPATLVVTEEGQETRTVEVGLEGPDGRPTPQLPTSEWDGSGMRMLALAEGRLTVEDSGCVTLGGGQPVWWPKGSSVSLDRRGRVILIDPSGAEVAREGDAMALGGGSVPGPKEGSPCVVGFSEVFLVQDELG